MNSTQTKNLSEIYEKYHQPLYLLNLERLSSNYRSLEFEFRNVYPNTKVAYSYKTNPVNDICCQIKELGGFAEVVSPYEMLYALNINPPKYIIYNGVISDPHGKSVHSLNGGIVNVDSIGEFIKVAKYLRGTNAKLGIRIRISESSRFGMTFAEIDDAISIALENGIAINGIHCHDGFSRSIDFWKIKISKAVEAANHIRKTFDIEYIDIGGRLCGDMDINLKEQFDYPIPSFKDYAYAVAGELLKSYGERGPALILEPGTALVGNCISILSCVSEVKSREPQDIVFLDVSFLDCGKMSKNRPIEIVKCDNVNHNSVNSVLITGSTCIESDIIHNNFNQKLSVGDLVLLKDCGAYSSALKSNFITQPLPTIIVDDDFNVINGGVV